LQVSEDFANRFLTRLDCQQGDVRDCVLGADVFGQQVTNTTTRLNFRPCETGFLADFEVFGEVRSSTVGVTPQAHVRSVGRHRLRLAKEVAFDGQVISTRSPSAWITPSQQNIGADTPASGWPIVGPLASGFVLQAAQARMPEAHRITAERITRQAVPRFNEQVDAAIARLNEQWRSLAETAQGANGTPLFQHDLSTTEDRAHWRLGAANEPLAAVVVSPPPALDRTHAATLLLHESLINALLDRVPLAGAAIPDVALDAWQRRIGGGAGESSPPQPLSLQPQLATIVFDRVHPLRVRFDGGQLLLVVRLGIRPVEGPEISVQEITIPFSVASTPEELRIEPGEVSLQPAYPDAPEGEIDEPARRVIRDLVQARLPVRIVPRVIPVTTPGGSSATLTFSTVELRDGWLILGID
jgi:hypothetical protein